MVLCKAARSSRSFGSSPHNSCACCRVGPRLPAIAHLLCGRLTSRFYLALFYIFVLILKAHLLNTLITYFFVLILKANFLNTEYHGRACGRGHPGGRSES